MALVSVLSTGNRADRNSVFFRFASEGNVVEKVEFYGREIAVGDLKKAIAERKSLSRYDLVIVNEATNEVYQKDGKMLPRNMSVTVRRTPAHSLKKPVLVLVDNNDIWSTPLDGEAKKARAVAAKPIERRACPPEYLCSLCGGIFSNPGIARCCGRSACAPCFEGRLAGCPLCSRPWAEETTPIPNPRLADSVAALNLEYFILPACKEQEVVISREADNETVPLAGVPPEPPAGAPPAGGAWPDDRPAAAAAASSSSSSAPAPPLASGAWPAGPLLPTPPPGLTVRPCMLSPEQFLAWQHSLRAGGAAAAAAESDSESSGGRERRRRRRDRSGKASRKRRRR